MEESLMKLASSTYWQTMYKAFKEGNIQLFNNISNLSAPQSEFLYCLKIYDICYEDLNNQEYPFLDEDLIHDPVRVRAFIYWRRDHINKKIKESKNPKKKSKKQPKRKYKIYQGPRPDDKKEGE